MTLDQLHAPPDCNLAPGPSAEAPLASKMFPPPDRTFLPNFVSPDRRRYPVRSDLRVGKSNVQCNLCLDAKRLERKRRARPSAMGRARITYLRPLPNADCGRLRLAFGDPHRGLTSPARSRLGLLEAAEARPIPAAPREELLKKSLTVLTVFPISPPSAQSFHI